jgi:hypothetical protein
MTIWKIRVCHLPHVGWKKKEKVNFGLEEAMKAQMGSRDKALVFL